MDATSEGPNFRRYFGSPRLHTRDFLLGCDGSGESLGAVLLQAHDEGEKVVAYASRSLLEHEKKWTSDRVGGRGPYLGFRDFPALYRRGSCDNSHGPRLST